MDDKKKAGRYCRIHNQLEALLVKTNDPLARMATICAVLHHKMDHFFWTGFYLLKEEKLIVGPYQGPVACQELEKEKGVCWTAVKNGAPVLVKNVHDFPGHIACDSRSKSEIALPVFDEQGKLKAVLDIDSDQLASFNEVDKSALEKIMKMIFLLDGH